MVGDGEGEMTQGASGAMRSCGARETRMIVSLAKGALAKFSKREANMVMLYQVKAQKSA
jgi:hypothetical protein